MRYSPENIINSNAPEAASYTDSSDSLQQDVMIHY